MRHLRFPLIVFSAALACLAGSPAARARSGTPGGADVGDVSDVGDVGDVSDDDRALDLVTVLQLARAQGPDALISAAQVDLAVANTARAASARFPTVGFSASASPGAQMTMPLLAKDDASLCTAGNISCSVGSVPVGSARASTGVDLRWRLFDFGATQANVDARTHAEKASRARAESSAIAVAAQASRRYLQVLADQRLLEVRARLASDRARQASVVKGRAELGEGAPSDVLQAEVAAEAAALDVEAIRAQLRADRAALLITIGLDPGDPRAVTGTLDVQLGAALRTAGVDLEAHPDVQAADATVAAAGDDVTRSELAFWPTIDGTASVGASLVAITSPTANLTPSAGVGLSLSWPWLDLGRDADIASARATHEVNRRQRQATLLTIQSAWAQALVNLEAQTALVTRARRLRDSAQQAVDVVEGRVAAGAGRLAELLDAQAALTQAEAAVIQAEANRAAAVVDVALAAGAVDDAHLRAGG